MNFFYSASIHRIWYEDSNEKEKNGSLYYLGSYNLKTQGKNYNFNVLATRVWALTSIMAYVQHYEVFLERKLGELPYFAFYVRELDVR